jgi:microcin C transport system permease protein
LDYLGFGLPPPTPSWGVLLREGMSRLDSEWIVGSVTIAMIAVLVMVTWIGEALREAFDPKQRTVYE